LPDTSASGPDEDARAPELGAVVIPFEPWEQVVAWAREVEELGLDYLWLPDHLVNPYGRRPFYESWTTLAALARETSRVRLGTLVTSIVFREPRLLAKQAIAVDHASGGRLEVGVGAGSGEDNEAAGLRPWTPRERSDRLRAFVEGLDDLLMGDERLGFPLQRPRPPLTIAAWSPRNLRLAAERADRWNTMGGYGLSADEGLARATQQNRLLDSLCRDVGRDPRSLVRSFLYGYRWVAETPFASTDAFARFEERYRDAGFDELFFYYPPERFSPDGTVSRDVLEELRP
jgi:alkanesulfonate monooxygenase SsuD/methylene tetrahydromethanopterin reductase-like flavin-dependent oxidoreductase (luciferase family)